MNEKFAHTPGKLVVSSIGVGFELESEAGEVIAQAQQVISQDRMQGLAIRKENARRLAACWNALDGIPTDQIKGKSLAEIVVGMTHLTGMQGGTIGLEGGACGLLAANFADQFKGSGAINFLEVRMGHPEVGEFTVTMQRQEGETPSQQIAALKKQRAELLEVLTACREELFTMIKRHNHPDDQDGAWMYDYQTIVESDTAIAKALGKTSEAA